MLEVEGERKALSGYHPSTTNNRMELTAVIRALGAIRSHDAWRSRNVVLHTDSQYVQKGITEWLPNWVRRNWRTAAKKPVKNQDLWKPLAELAHSLTVEWRWVRGHVGTELNELCDAMVQIEIARGGMEEAPPR